MRNCASGGREMVGRRGLEPQTNRLRVCCSTIELTAHLGCRETSFAEPRRYYTTPVWLFPEGTKRVARCDAVRILWALENRTASRHLSANLQ